jgi:hypothetical protein
MDAFVVVVSADAGGAWCFFITIFNVMIEFVAFKIPQ